MTKNPVETAYVYYELDTPDKKVTMPINRAANFVLSATLEAFPEGSVSIKNLHHPTTKHASIARRVQANLLDRLRHLDDGYTLQPVELADLLGTSEEGAVRLCEESYAILDGGNGDAEFFTKALDHFEAALKRSREIKRRAFINK